jgi:hypothetical protein
VSGPQPKSDEIVVLAKTINGAIIEADGWSFISCPGCGALINEWLTEFGPDTMEWEECPMCVEASRDEDWWF